MKWTNQPNDWKRNEKANKHQCCIRESSCGLGLHMLLDLKDDCRRKINAVMHLANCSYTTDRHFSPLLRFGHVTICGHCLSASFALDKSNFMASDLFNLILSIEFLQRFWSKNFCRIDSVYICVYMWHMLCCSNRITNSQKRNHPTQPTSILSLSKNQCIRWTFFFYVWIFKKMWNNWTNAL